MKKECYTCKYDKDCHWDDCLCGDPPTRWEPAEHYKPDTNADRIRAMSDEELAKYLHEIGWDCHLCSEHKRLDNQTLLRGEKCDEKCVEHCLEWLKQPAEEG